MREKGQYLSLKKNGCWPDIHVPLFILEPGKSVKPGNVVEKPTKPTQWVVIAKGSFHPWIEKACKRHSGNIFLMKHNISLLQEKQNWHSSHIPQSLDTGNFGQMKGYYCKCETYLSQTNTNIFDARKSTKRLKHILGSIFATAYYDAITPSNMTNAFHNTGIWPENNLVSVTHWN